MGKIIYLVKEEFQKITILFSYLFFQLEYNTNMNEEKRRERLF
jgi:hypothetical protein